jgi:hypothetical protein
MIDRFTKIAILVVGAIAVVVVLVALMMSGPSHPSDETMIRYFQENRRQFVELLQMFQKDSGLDSVGELAANSPDNPQTVGGDEMRIQQYLTLRKQLNVQTIERNYNNEVLFITSTYGLSVSGSRKGYVYSETPPTSITTADAKPTGEAYGYIEGNWYLYYEWTT